MVVATSLDELLESANWSAIDEAKGKGSAAIPALRRFASHKNYQTRQIVMTAVGRIGDPQGADILAQGLTDANINVRQAAANELSLKPYPGANEAILVQLIRSPDEMVRESLALAAGYIPGPRAMEILRPMAQESGQLAVNARMALAKLGDGPSRQAIIDATNDPLPRTRYEALAQLRYVGDPALVVHAKKRLSDREPAQRIGVKKAPRYRRVCDQAVDTVVHLMKLKPPFEVNLERIYSEDEIQKTQKLSGA